MVNFERLELLQKSESYDCTVCEKKTEAETRIKVSQTGDIVVINLKRQLYKGKTLKNNAVISAPLWITIDSH